MHILCDKWQTTFIFFRQSDGSVLGPTLETKSIKHAVTLQSSDRLCQLTCHDGHDAHPETDNDMRTIPHCGHAGLDC